jgi:hypothetical protein
MNVILNEEQSVCLKKNKEMLTHISKFNRNHQYDNYLRSTILADEINGITYWKVQHLKNPQHYFYVPSYDYTKIYTPQDFIHYGAGMINGFEYDQNFQAQIKLIEEQMKPYFKFRCEQYNYRPPINNTIHSLRLNFNDGQWICVLNLFELKNVPIIDYLLKIMVNSNNSKTVVLEKNMALEHLQEINLILNETSQLEKSVDKTHKSLIKNNKI